MALIAKSALGDIAAEAILKAPQCFWSAALARQRLFGGTLRSDSTEETVKVKALGAHDAHEVGENPSADTSVVFCGIASPLFQDCGIASPLFQDVYLLGHSVVHRCWDEVMTINVGRHVRASFESEAALDQAA